MKQVYVRFKGRDEYVMLQSQIPPGLWELLRAEAFKKDTSVSAVVTQALRQYFKP